MVLISIKGMLKNLMNFYNLLSFTIIEAKKAAEIEANLESQGKVIGLKDVLMSSIAISNNCTIVTGNVKHFNKIQGIKVESWK
jgi:tRNA(fMet)-specific endonuclease VapC